VRETIEMSRKDLDRLHILKKVQAKELTQVRAAEILDLSDRQIRKLLTRLNANGPSGIISKLVGRSSNRSLPVGFKQRITALLREKYEGFGPTLAAEKLYKLDGLVVSVETVRKWMIETKLWIPRRIRKKMHIPRARRSYFGELIQADGSHHRWFGDDGPMVNATVLIDDATSTITGLHFSEGETLEGYFNAMTQHFQQYGRPLAFYTDHFSIFRHGQSVQKTQMQRALDELGIELILASSPQAKGRVERVNRVLQDRLVKEFHLRGIKTIEQANVFAKEYVEEHNKAFSKRPISNCDAHRPLEGYDLPKILCRKETRSLDSSAIFHFNNRRYQLQDISELRRLSRRKVEVRTTREGGMRVFIKGKEFKVLPLEQVINPPKELSRKEVLTWKSMVRKVGSNHPWRTNKARKSPVVV
jgi:transposase InsO family protein